MGADDDGSGGDPDARKIIHCDCDCFYARDRDATSPRAAFRPLAVGGRAESRG